MKKIILSLLCITALKADTFLDDYQRLVETGDGQGINLSGLEIGKMLTALSEKHVNLNLKYANLENADLQNAIVQHSFEIFQCANLHNTNFNNSRIGFQEFKYPKRYQKTTYLCHLCPEIKTIIENSNGFRAKMITTQEIK